MPEPARGSDFSKPEEAEGPEEARSGLKMAQQAPSTDKNGDQKDSARNQQDASATTNIASSSPETANEQSSSTAPDNQEAGQEQPIKQFSDKTLHQLADYYQNLAPVDIPDTGFVVSGIAGRFPNADNLNELWENLRFNRDMVRGPDDKRWPLGLWDLPKKAARIKDISRFDNEFFAIPKETADVTDHQLRNLYEVVYESMLDAGINPASVRGDKRTGLFFGFHTAETETEFGEKPNFKTTGYQHQLLTATTSYFDIQGVSGSYDAACASSFAAFHQAVINLKAGLVDTAIVCAVNISVRPGTSYQFLLLQMLSPTGSSKFLDAAADGYAKTEACVSVVLQRKDVAKRSYAAIVHTKCNNDGFKVEGITYPSSQVQEQLMKDSIIEAGVDPRQIVYVEAHGTGTPAGDPEEARAIAKVYCEKRDQPLLIGSVKSNLGHAEGVSGLCSLAKVICTFENELLPSNLHYYKPNPNIQPLVEGRLKPVDQNIPFKHNLIPMNCYGFGGVNVHGIFKSHARKIDESKDYDIAPDYPRLITMFGRSQAAIEYIFEELKKEISENDDIEEQQEEASKQPEVEQNNSSKRKKLTSNYRKKRLATRDYLALIDSINDGPIDKRMNYRGYLLLDNQLKEISSSIVEMNDAINSLAEINGYILKNDKYDPKSAGRRQHFQDMNKCVWFILPGLGCQWRGMGKHLLQFEPTRRVLQQLAQVLEPLGVDLIDVLSNEGEPNVFEDNVVNLFTGIVSVQIALIDLLRLLNVKPKGIIGHSIGEISCAYADELLSASETIQLAYYLAKPIDDAKLHSGAMAAVSLTIKQAEKYLGNFSAKKKAEMGAKFKKLSIEIACINGDESLTLSGESDEIDQFVDMLISENVYARRIVDVKTAFHNSSLRVIEKELVESVQKLFNNNKVEGSHGEGQFRSKNWFSTLYGTLKEASLADTSGSNSKQLAKEQEGKFEINAHYFVQNLCSPVKFRDAIESIQSPDNTIIVEVGPHGLFHPILKQKYLTKLQYASLMKRMDGSVESLLVGLGKLYQQGQSLKLARLYPEVEFPVAKGTGSVSSLIRWNHQTQFQVAKYPENFRRPPCEARVKFDLIDESDKYLAGHCVDGRILFPATGYLYMVWRSFSLTKDKAGNSPINSTGEPTLIPVEFNNVRLYRATILGSAPVELMVRVEEATGQFEVREGGSVVVDGYISQPTINPDGLQYEHIHNDPKFKEKEMTLEPDDVYKQFRVCGYDYGESFRNIVSASSDGLRVQVKWNGKFIPFSDSVLQSLFLAICKKTSALFLPTKFEYMRINPNMLYKKVEAAAAEGKPCILEAYCELETGIIVTDGIEMRGVGASPAPRRLQQEPVLESYQFIPNVEREIRDVLAKSMNSNVEKYVKMCSTAAYKILSNLKESKAQIESLMAGLKLADDSDLNKYLDDNEQSEHHVLLQILDKILASQEEPESEPVCRGGMEPEEEAEAAKSAKSSDANDETEQKTETETDEAGKKADKSGQKAEGPSRQRKIDPKLRCIEELKKQFEKVVKSEFDAIKSKLGLDLMSSGFSNERFLRPILEIALENTHTQKIKLLELNPGDALKFEPISNISAEIMPNLSINYFLGHPATNTLPSGSLPQDTKLYTWTPATKALHRELQDLDLVIYNDSSCYPMKKDQFTAELEKSAAEIKEGESETDKELVRESVEAIFESIYECLKPNAFALVLLRQQLSPAEKFLYKIADYEVTQKAERLEKMYEAGKKAKLQLIGEKTDIFGCTLLLFRKLDESLKVEEQNLLHIRDGEHSNWLEPLKYLMNNIKAKSASESVNKNVWLISNDSPSSGLVGMVNCLRKEPGGERIRFLMDQRRSSPFKFSRKEMEFEKITKVEKKKTQVEEGEVTTTTSTTTTTTATEVNGEQKKNSDEQKKEQVEIEEIREIIKSDAFIDIKSILESQQQDQSSENDILVNLIKQDLTYNCIDSSGQYGSYRHITISDILDNQVISTKDAYVNAATRGDLSSFKWYEAPYRFLDEKQKEKLITIYYSSLNFRDIMLASGRLPLDAIPVCIALSDCILGLEFSGRLTTGERRAGLVACRALGTSILFDETTSIVFKIPDRMSLEEAASIPTVYLTALMSLSYRGRIQAGETILIHSGSGGVGQAAIRICHHYGLTVYTTVGNQEKREFLKQEFPQLTDANIFNSRDCTFETDVMKATNGRGVDVVLNSLSEEKLQASIRCLADGGRFLEIGKYDMALNNPIELMLMDTNKTFHGILLDKLFDTQDNNSSRFHTHIQNLVKTLEDGLEDGWIQPIRRTIFERTQIEDSFRYMSSGKHIGKVVIKIRDEEVDPSKKDSEGNQLYENIKPEPILVEAQPRALFNPRASYIITGGLGGFGLELAKWLAANGARNLVLTSRSGIKSGYQDLVVTRLRENSVNVIVSLIDNSTDEGAEALVREAQKLAPLAGIFNLAMVLRDSLLENATPEQFEEVCRPKCRGVAALDRATRKLAPEMDLFVAFSSVSCGKGNAGQANYGYANSVMERICETRRRDKLHGLAVQWGAIGDVGVAFENLGGNEAVIGGTVPQRMPSCFATLAKFLASPFSVCLSILQADRRSFGAGKKGDLVKTILHVLGIKDPSTVDPNTTLGELGLDSLMAVEIRQALEREYDIVLTVQEIRALTINRIREIGDGDTSNAKKPSEAAAGGSGDAAALKQEDYLAENQEKLVAIVPGITINVQENGERIFSVDKSFAAKAPLKLPKEDLILLNGDTGIKLSGNPIFIMPPIQGDFSRLSMLTKKFKRPCVGINWNHKMVQFQTIDQAVEEHLKVIRHYYPKLKTLDLIGYSFGAAMSFEIMLYIQMNSFEPPLNPGKLVLLDGSPDQINIGVKYITTTLESSDESVRAAEVMSIFLMQHSRFDYADLKKRILIHPTNEAKLDFAADLLAKTLGITDQNEAQEIHAALEGYCRRFQIMLNYEAKPVKLDSDVTLIRATEIYVGAKDHEVDEDYGLSRQVAGRVNSCLMKGNHESFLDDNVDQISSLLQDIICPVLD